MRIARQTAKRLLDDLDGLPHLFDTDDEAVEAVVLGHDFELAVYNRDGFLLKKEQLLVSKVPNVIVRAE